MVSDTRDNPPYRGNFIERLYEKTLSLLAESKFTPECKAQRHVCAYRR